jgi:hypothetical protein
MSTPTLDPVTVQPHAFELPRVLAPVSNRLAVRARTIYAVMCLLGFAPSILGLSPAWRAAGLGLVFPGGGLLAAGGLSYALFALAIFLFAAALAAWLLTGNIVAPLAVWLGALALGTARVGTAVAPAAPYVVAGFVVAVVMWRAVANRTEHRRRLATRDLRLQYLPGQMREIAARAAPRPAIADRELSEKDVAAARYLLDRALQPVDEFNGFDVIDQFQTAAVRYQITFSQFTLGLLQSQYTPNFHGYLSTAQRNLINKFTQRKVWSYWVYESLLGNLSLNFDPIGRDNIMLGGFFNGNVSLYMRNTGDKSFAQPGSLPFALTGQKIYRHDAATLASAARRNFQESGFCLYPCEPNFAYSYCNLVGLAGIRLNDFVFGTAYAPDILARFRENLESEFTSIDGSLIAGRVALTGARIAALESNFGLIGYAWLANPHFPDIAQRIWAIVRKEFIELDEHGALNLRLTPFDKVDIGNYRKSAATILAQTLISAREHGDQEVAEAALREIDRSFIADTEGGVLSYSDVSNYNNIHFILGRIMRKGDWRATIAEAPSEGALKGPILTGAGYPQVLVARARSTGSDLSLVLYPGTRDTRQRIKIERLRPNADYSINGDASRTFRSDDRGSADLDLQLSGRTEIQIDPV